MAMDFDQQLSTWLNQESSCLQQLVDVLQLEYDALLNGDIDVIEAATKAKNQALNAQTAATQARQAFTTANLAGSSADLQQFMADRDSTDPLAVSFSELTALAGQCREANHRNGRLIVQKQAHTRGALAIIRQTDNQPDTYSNQGNAATAHSSRSLGKA
ncbi:MAG: flagella synthesis protein FlgN [Halieaceae bacterium]|jgi:flagella synthesis protein FlgN